MNISRLKQVVAHCPDGVENVFLACATNSESLNSDGSTTDRS